MNRQRNKEEEEEEAERGHETINAFQHEMKR